MTGFARKMATLGEMNEKQRLKEFKRVGKELKSKDVNVREEALKVIFEEHAYLIEGKGLLALLDGVAAKKVRMYSLRPNTPFLMNDVCD